MIPVPYYLGISGLFFALIPTIVAMIITAIYRSYFGRRWNTDGRVSVIIATGTIGISDALSQKKTGCQSKLERTLPVWNTLTRGNVSTHVGTTQGNRSPDY